MNRVSSWFAPPPAGADPRPTLEWVRRMELVFGVAAILLAVTYWGQGWVSWVLLGVGVLGLSPWPGAQRILHKAESKPDVLVTDPARRRARARRVVLLLVPAYAVAGGVVGYLIDGWPAAAFTAFLIGLGGSIGGWWAIRREARN